MVVVRSGTSIRNFWNVLKSKRRYSTSRRFGGCIHSRFGYYGGRHGYRARRHCSATGGRNMVPAAYLTAELLNGTTNVGAGAAS